MIDENIIKENYAHMQDDQLIHLAQFEQQSLTPEALTFLKEEFLKRNLNIDLFDAPQPATTPASDFINAMWGYVFKEKEAGTSNEVIYLGMLHRGLDEQHATEIINGIENKTIEILAANNKNVLRGAITCLAGVAVAIWTYSPNYNSTIYGVAWAAIVFGVLWYFKGVSSKSKYKTILNTIETEQIISAETTAFIDTESKADTANDEIK